MYTVKELIETLKQCPEDYEVLINYIEDIYSPIEEVGIDHKEKTVDLFAE